MPIELNFLLLLQVTPVVFAGKKFVVIYQKFIIVLYMYLYDYVNKIYFCNK